MPVVNYHAHVSQGPSRRSAVFSDCAAGTSERSKPSEQAKKCIHSVQASTPYREAKAAGHILHIEPYLREKMYNDSMKRVFTDPLDPESRYCVPNRLHFIWLGEILPASFAVNLQSYVTHLGAKYEIWLWGDREHVELPAGIEYRSVNDYEFTTTHLRSTIPSLAEQSDILRYEIIYLFGGIYVDIDSTCQKPFDTLFRASFVCHTFDMYNNIQNAMFGFPPQSQFMRFVLQSLMENYLYFDAKQDSFLPNRAGPQFFTACFLQFADPAVTMVDQSIVMHSEGQSYVLHQYAYSWKGN